MHDCQAAGRDLVQMNVAFELKVTFAWLACPIENVDDIPRASWVPTHSFEAESSSVHTLIASGEVQMARVFLLVLGGLIPAIVSSQTLIQIGFEEK